MPSVDRVRKFNQVRESNDRGVCRDRGLTQVGEVLPAVLARYGFIPATADRPTTGAIVAHGVAENRTVTNCLTADNRLPWEFEVAC